MTTLRYEFNCSICGASETQIRMITAHELPPIPRPPDGWRDVLGEMVCRNHKIEADLYVVSHDCHPDAIFRRRKWRCGLEL
jgi:hypothetical protein